MAFKLTGFQNISLFYFLIPSGFTYTYHMDLKKKSNFRVFFSDKFMEESKTKKSQTKFSEAGTHTVCKALSIVN